MTRNAQIIQDLRTYTDQRIPLLWGALLVILLAAHLATAFLVEIFWVDHYPVTPWVVVAAVLAALAFFLYEKIGGKLGAYEFDFKRSAMGVWDYERGYMQCDSIRRAAGLGFVGVTLIYGGFLFGQFCAATEAERRVLIDLDPQTQLQALANPEQGVLLGAGVVLLAAAFYRIQTVKETIRKDLSG